MRQTCPKFKNLFHRDFSKNYIFKKCIIYIYIKENFYCLFGQVFRRLFMSSLFIIFTYAAKQPATFPQIYLWGCCFMIWLKVISILASFPHTVYEVVVSWFLKKDVIIDLFKIYSWKKRNYNLIIHLWNK